MRKIKRHIQVYSSLLICFLTIAPMAKSVYSPDKLKELIQRNKHVHCEFTKHYLLQTVRGTSTSDLKPKRVVFFEGMAPKGDAIYSLSWENDDVSFYYYMNSQTGAIHIRDKYSGDEAVSHLDISDLEKEGIWGNSARVAVGEVGFSHVEIIPVKNMFGHIVPGERHIDFSAICWRERI